MTQINHGSIFKTMEKWAPKRFAYEWDNVGLQVGSSKDLTKGVLITLDVNEAVVDEAIDKDTNLIIAHHPMLFRPMKQIDLSTVKGKLIKKLIQHEITVYASHTNLDIAVGGVNDLLSERLGLNNVKPLMITHTDALIKLAVFTPISHVTKVVDALSDAGAGHIGNYSHCTFQSAGTGTFMPLEGTNPYIGNQNELEKVDEIKIETIVPEKKINQVVQAMKQAHPYEEVAYDLFPLNNKGESFGLGRIGELEETFTLQQYVHVVKEKFNVNHLRFVGDRYKKIKRVAILGGSGEKYIEEAKRAGADVYITGDLTFHHAQDAKEIGLALIDPGHYIEQIMKKATKDYLQQKFPKLTLNVSEINTEPFQFL